jgi:hypothetical protein
MGALEILIVLAIVGGLYMLPTIIAFSRGHHQAVAIAVLNVFLGWTFLGWVGALVWSATHISPDVSPSGGVR